MVAAARAVTDGCHEDTQSPSAFRAVAGRIELAAATRAYRAGAPATRTEVPGSVDRSGPFCHITDERTPTGMRRSDNIRMSSSGGRPRVVR